MFKKSLMVILLGFVMACASAETRIVSHSGGLVVVSKAYNESRAYQGAVAAAQAYCQKMGKEVVISEKNSSSQQADSTKGNSLEVADGRAPQGGKSGGRSGSERQTSRSEKSASDDKQITLDFYCR